MHHVVGIIDEDSFGELIKVLRISLLLVLLELGGRGVGVVAKPAIYSRMRM
jgi:hypothetical protein